MVPVLHLYRPDRRMRKRKSELRRAIRGSQASSLHIYGSRHVRAESVGRLTLLKPGPVDPARLLWRNGPSLVLAMGFRRIG